MSEHQYYEFLAIDRPLSRDDIAELRSRSSRATISSTSFTNEYHWGSLKADPADWLRRYFDAFVYTANWGSCRLALRLPHHAFKKAELRPFLTQSALTAEAAGTHWIIDWSLDESQDFDRFAMETGQGWMGSLALLREELLRGDLRPLYLGWLAGVGVGEVDDDALEPDVPPGLSQLSGAQKALVEFLEIDLDLLSAAAKQSQALEASRHDDDSIAAWLAGLDRRETGTLMTLLVQGASQQAERRAKAAFSAWRKENGSCQTVPAKRRTVTELRILANKAETLRLKQQEKARAKHEAARRQQREAYLRSLAADLDPHWKLVHQHAERGTASAYDSAARAITDLAESYALTSNQKGFDKALRQFMVRHAKRGALVRRLVEAGLWTK